MVQEYILVLTPSEQTAWDVYFSGIVSLRCHPANDGQELDLEWCADVVAKMLEVRRRRTVCRGS